MAQASVVWRAKSMNPLDRGCSTPSKILGVKVLTGKILIRKELALDSAARNAGWGREVETGWENLKATATKVTS
jgi:hypothetical protein